MARVLCISSKVETGRACIARLLPFIGEVENPQFASHNGSSLNFKSREGELVHVYAAGSQQFEHVLISSEFPLLPANDFTLAWLYSIVERVSGGYLWIEFKNIEHLKHHNRIVPETISNKLPAVVVEKITDTLWRIENTGTALGTTHSPDLPTSFSDMYRATEEYKNLYIGAIKGNQQGGRAEKHIIYSMTGANKKSWLIELITASSNAADQMEIFDGGGGCGHFAVEMASKGHRVRVYDHDPAKIEVLGPWLAQKCHVNELISFQKGRLEDLVLPRAVYDLVTLFGSLLYAEKKAVAGILQNAWHGLKPGGWLAIQELPKEKTKPDIGDYDRQFFTDDLYRLIASNASIPQYYSLFNGAKISRVQASQKSYLAVVQKS